MNTLSHTLDRAYINNHNKPIKLNEASTVTTVQQQLQK